MLVAGEGNGRFLCELRRVVRSAHITCVDASARMLALTRDRLDRHGLAADSVEFIHSDILNWTAPTGRFDLIVTHFFLDCFPPEPLARVIHSLASAGTTNATWLLADFQIPAARFKRYRAHAIHWAMYLFFRATAALRAHRLTAPDDALRANGFNLHKRVETDWALLHSDEWKRS